ncbi:hypothetical protein MXD59_02325 [Frankia sp. Ag45/Mut15]|uniref:Ketosynthase family 3 (KS3) domain-containing protein n=1 Tax=Frankia umida TaxID=573489 RepID=A0ABT0JTD3_9ACTN|nr:beta-ketoacyl synthase N-terminal-like domain-containing protein [Frankia umida]MCK9874629.1 hypothetical protein [Frankia umida]
MRTEQNRPDAPSIPVTGHGHRDGDGDIVIRGIGVVTAAGCGATDFWAGLLRAEPAFTRRSLFGPDTAPVVMAIVPDADLAHGLPRRHTKRVDRFTLLATAAVREALADAGLAAPDAVDPDRIGIVTANATGGWSFVEPQLYGLYGEGDSSAINSYVATAWFPTAPQGEISIAFGLGGFSKTVAAERISGAVALEMAATALTSGRLDVVVVCGVEAPCSALVHNACRAAGLVSPSGSYRPYDTRADGVVLGEGAGALVLTRGSGWAGSAARGGQDRPVYARIEAIEIGGSLPAAISRVAAAAAERPTATTGVHVVGDGRGTAADLDELRALAAASAASAADAAPAAPLSVSAPATVYGDLLGAGFVVKIVTACLTLRHQVRPPTAVGVRPREVSGIRHVLDAQRDTAVTRIVVNGTDDHGQGACVALTGLSITDAGAPC